MKFILKSDGRKTRLGSFNQVTKSIRIYLCHSVGDTIDERINGISNTIHHEYIHKTIAKLMTHEDFKGVKYYITGNEWTTRILLKEELGPLSLIDYMYSDIINEFGACKFGKDSVFNAVIKRYKIVHRILTITSITWMLLFFLSFLNII
jgi:hypothetical protein